MNIDRAIREKVLTAHPHLSELDDYSLLIMSFVMERYPQWTQYAEADGLAGEKYLEVRVPAPVNPTDSDLKITTDGEELTIWFEDWFDTVDGWGDTSDIIQEIFDYACKTVDALVAEEAVMLVLRGDDNSTTWAVCSPEKVLKIPVPPGSIGYIRSWRGTHNCQYD